MKKSNKCPNATLPNINFSTKNSLFGLWREDYRTAQLAHLTAMINRDPKGKAPELAEFMPFFNRSEDVEEMEDNGVADYLAKR